MRFPKLPLLILLAGVWSAAVARDFSPPDPREALYSVEEKNVDVMVILYSGKGGAGKETGENVEELQRARKYYFALRGFANEALNGSNANVEWQRRFTDEIARIGKIAGILNAAPVLDMKIDASNTAEAREKLRVTMEAIEAVLDQRKAGVVRMGGGDFARVRALRAPQDCAEAIARGDLRFMAVNGITPGIVPGIDYTGKDRKLIEEHGKQYIPDTSDTGSMEYNLRAQRYAEIYNRILLVYLRGKDKQ